MSLFKIWLEVNNRKTSPLPKQSQQQKCAYSKTISPKLGFQCNYVVASSSRWGSTCCRTAKMHTRPGGSWHCHLAQPHQCACELHVLHPPPSSKKLPERQANAVPRAALSFRSNRMGKHHGYHSWRLAPKGATSSKLRWSADVVEQARNAHRPCLEPGHREPRSHLKTLRVAGPYANGIVSATQQKSQKMRRAWSNEAAQASRGKHAFHYLQHSCSNAAYQPQSKQASGSEVGHAASWQAPLYGLWQRQKPWRYICLTHSRMRGNSHAMAEVRENLLLFQR